jgi:pimeloyl-ACP methyl ester carboxylesterase
MGVRRAVGLASVTGVAAAVGVVGWLAPIVFDRDARRRLRSLDDADLGPQVPTPDRLAAAEGSFTADPRVRRTTVNGTELPYRDEGQGPPVLLIHGGGGGWWAWDPLVDELATDHRVIAYSRRGYTGTAELATAWRQHRIDAAALLDQLGVREAVVVAWSGGGSVALELAVARPDLVAGVVLFECSVYPRRNLTPELVRALLALRLRRALLPDEQAIDAIFRHVAFVRDDGSSRWEGPDLPETFRFGILATAEAAFNDLDLTAFSEALPPDELATITCPVTLLIGERTHPWFAQNADHLQSIVPDARRIEVPDGDHALPYVDPAGTAAAVRAAPRGLRLVS